MWYWRQVFQKLSCLSRNDCGTGDKSFRCYHVYRGMIVVLEISLTEVIMFTEEWLWYSR